MKDDEDAAEYCSMLAFWFKLACSTHLPAHRRSGFPNSIIEPATMAADASDDDSDSLSG